MFWIFQSSEHVLCIIFQQQSKRLIIGVAMGAINCPLAKILATPMKRFRPDLLTIIEYEKDVCTQIYCLIRFF